MFAAALGAATAMLVLDLGWLGVVARGFYDGALGPLKRQPVHAGAAALFYGMYVAAIVLHGALPATSARAAARRGAGLGFVCYATYELTNWAVLSGWPAVLVPVDIAWGTALTALASVAAFAALQRVRGGPPPAAVAPPGDAQ